ncbi:MAG: choice-of-anchor B family protein [Xanthomonadales bacterium]|jgi:choice-of-anchor B domain-containing protein|nr:choice-of-anchor B family protein [Xanthomonadales bacterium]
MLTRACFALNTSFRLATILGAGLLLSAQALEAQSKGKNPVQPEHDDHGPPPIIVQATEGELCKDGVSGGYPCRNVEMLSRVPLDELGGNSGNDSWGWKDQETGHYYALMGLDNGVAFVDVSDPADPVLVGRLPTADRNSTWRDIKVYRDHAYIVADSNPRHGMQVLALHKLRDGSPDTVFQADFRYDGFGSAHNIAINEDTGFAFVVGSDTCDGGLHMLDLSIPDEPAFVGCFSDDGYTHDAHCVTYDGPSEGFAGQELCFASNEDSLTIANVTDKSSPALVSRLAYPNVGYTHQGWLSDDQRWFVLGDELDELDTGTNGRTLVFDVSDPENPRYVGAHYGANNTIDHNLYLRGKYVFQANYSAGLRILLAEDFGTARLREVAYFDTAPEAERRAFQGAWSVYPYFDHGVILVSDMQSGLFVLRANLNAAENAPINGRLSGAYASPMFPDQGMTLTVGENINGPFIFAAWFLYLDGQPFWLVGTAPFTYGESTVDITMLRLSGPGFLEADSAGAGREEVGNLNLHAHSCNAVHLLYDFGDLGSGELHMENIAAVQGRECPPSEHYRK